MATTIIVLDTVNCQFNPRVIREPQLRVCLDQAGLWDVVLIMNYCRWAQPTAGSIIHGQVILGYTRKLAKPEP